MGTFGIPFIEYVSCNFDWSVAPTGVGGVDPFPWDKSDPGFTVNLSNSPIIYVLVFIINI